MMGGRGLPFELFLGLRYLRARGQRTSLSLFVWIGIGGVFLGVSALIVVLAVMTGFQDGIKDKIIAANPHMLVVEAGGRGMADGAAVAARLAPVDGVVSATPFVLQQALFTAPGGGATGGLLRGVDLASPAVRAGLAGALKAGSLDPLLARGGEPALVLGRELARNLGVVPGDYVTVISPQGAMTAVGLVPKMRRFTVAGYFEVGMYEHDSSLAYTTLAAAQEFAGLGDRVTGVEVKLADPFEAKAVGRRLAAAAGGPFWIRDWMDMNRNLFAALQLEKLALFVIVTIIVLVAGFAIIGHLVLLVAEKRKEIGILKAMGATSGSHRRGVPLGRHAHRTGGNGGGQRLRAAAHLGAEHLQDHPARRRRVPDRPPADEAHGRDFALVVGATLVISFLATLSPARRAAGLDPVDVLRYE